MSYWASLEIEMSLLGKRLSAGQFIKESVRAKNIGGTVKKCVFYVKGSRPLPREVLQCGRSPARAQAALPLVALSPLTATRPLAAGAAGARASVHKRGNHSETHDYACKISSSRLVSSRFDVRRRGARVALPLTLEGPHGPTAAPARRTPVGTRHSAR